MTLSRQLDEKNNELLDSLVQIGGHYVNNEMENGNGEDESWNV